MHVGFSIRSIAAAQPDGLPRMLRHRSGSGAVAGRGITIKAVKRKVHTVSGDICQEAFRKPELSAASWSLCVCDCTSTLRGPMTQSLFGMCSERYAACGRGGIVRRISTRRALAGECTSPGLPSLFLGYLSIIAFIADPCNVRPITCYSAL